jgi:hypothetical protein
VHDSRKEDALSLASSLVRTRKVIFPWSFILSLQTCKVCFSSVLAKPNCVHVPPLRPGLPADKLEATHLFVP